MFERHEIITDSPFLFEAGGRIEKLKIVYCTSPGKYIPGKKVVWICHALTANANPEEWWPDMVGKGKFLDPEKYFIVCVSALCSPYGSTCPASTDPATGKPYLKNFPKTTVRDVARTYVMVRKELGIESIDLLVGSSSGGYQAYEMAVLDAPAIKHAMFIATAPVMPAFLSATCESQRMAIEADRTYEEAKDIHGGEKGMECARTIALMSYRTPECYQIKQAEQDPEFMFAGRAASYQRHQGEKLVKRGFDAYCYYRLCDLIDSQNLGRGRGGVEKALGQISADCTVVAIKSDLIFPPMVVKPTVQYIPKARYREIESVYGHDGFLLEIDQLIEILKEIL